MFGSCFRTLAVILVSDLIFFTFSDNFVLFFSVVETPVYRGIFHRVYTRWVDKLKVGYKLQLGGQAKSRVQTSVGWTS